MPVIRHRLSFFLIASFFIFLAVSCDGNDDDDSSDDSGPVADDSADDTTPADDSGDDNDDSDDSDDSDDNDDADDDSASVDWSGEPLAILSCNPLSVLVGETVSFDATGSTDPNDRALAHFLDFDDGETSTATTADHAFDSAGAYRVTLTVTNDEGFSDAAVCLVQVGSLPTAPGDLDEIDFKPNFFNDAIIEIDAPAFHGGVIYGFFTSPQAEAVDTILINGDVGHPDTADVEWCELLPADLMPEGLGVVQCHSYSESFDPGEMVGIEVKAGAETVWSSNVTIPSPSLSPTFITANVPGDEILVYVRNDGTSTALVDGLAVDGADVSDFAVIENDFLEPGDTALIRVPRHEGIDYGIFHVFTVFGSTDKSDVRSSRVHRLFPPVFPVGNWDGSSDDIYHNMENLDQQLEHGIDMHIYYPNGDNPPDTVVPLAEEKDFYLFTHYDGTDATYEQYINDHGDSPNIAANAVFGEPDLNNPAIDMIPRMQLQRSLWGNKKPLWGYNACAHRWPAFQSLPDIGGMDHYCVFAPKCNYNWPYFYWDHLWFLGYYSESAKRNAEPKSVWDWTQGNSWGDLYFFNRCLTDDEIRAQWYVVLGRGVKGILWFRFTQEWIETCPGPLPAMKALAHELDAVKPYLLEGEWYTQDRYLTTPDETIDAQATIGPRGAVLVLTNFHYKLNLISPWVWHEKINIPVDFMPPAGFEPAAFQMVQDEELVDLEWRKIADGHWRFTLPSLTVAQMILVTPEP